MSRREEIRKMLERIGTVENEKVIDDIMRIEKQGKFHKFGDVGTTTGKERLEKFLKDGKKVNK